MADRRLEPPAILAVRDTSAECADAVTALVAGRAGVVVRADELELLPEALRVVAAGFAVVSTAVVERARAVAELPAGERALLALVARGEGNEAIAAVLEISPSSVKRALVRLRRRLGVEGRPALIRAAQELGFGKGSPD
jgi:DNA-binding NarL/FixJ family response regulator